MSTIPLLLALALSCGEDKPDTGGSSDGGALDGGGSDGGTTDGGGTDGGGTDGGGTDGGGMDGGGADGGGDTGALDLAALLVDQGGCSDVFIWAASSDQAWALTFSDDSDMARRASEAGGTITETYDMAMDYGRSPTLGVQRGSDLRAAFCNDVVEPFTIDQQWWMTAGTVSISVTPTGAPKKWGAYPSTATLVLDGAIFTASGAEPVEIGHYEETVDVGWLPG